MATDLGLDDEIDAVKNVGDSSVGFADAVTTFICAFRSDSADNCFGSAAKLDTNAPGGVPVLNEEGEVESGIPTVGDPSPGDIEVYEEVEAGVELVNPTNVSDDFKRITGLAWTGSKLYGIGRTSQGYTGIWDINVATGTLTHLASATASLFLNNLTWNGVELIAFNNSGTIYTISTSGAFTEGPRSTLSRPPTGNYYITWDGSQLYIIGTSNLYAVNRNSAAATRVGTAGALSGAFSGNMYGAGFNGNTIHMLSSSGGSGYLYRIDRVQGTATPEPMFTRFQGDPNEMPARTSHEFRGLAWSGQFYYTIEIGRGALCRIRLTTGGQKVYRQPTPTIPPDGSIGTDQLADGGVTNVKLAQGSVLAPNLAPDAILTASIKDEQITNDKLVDGTIENAKIAPSAIATDNIQDEQITNAKIAPDSIEADRIKVNAIITDKIIDNAITKEKIKAAAIETEKVRDGAITHQKFTPAPYGSITLLSNTLTWNVRLQPHAHVLLTRNVTTVVLQETKNGGVYSIIIEQDPTGGRTFEFPSSWVWRNNRVGKIATAAGSTTSVTIQDISGVINVAPLFKRNSLSS